MDGGRVEERGDLVLLIILTTLHCTKSKGHYFYINIGTFGEKFGEWRQRTSQFFRAAVSFGERGAFASNVGT